jgi:hypothetical protein
MGVTVLVPGEGVGEGAGFLASPRAERRRMGDPEGDAGGVLFGSATGVKSGGLEVELAGGWSVVRNFWRMLEASLGESVVVVVELRELANSVTVTVSGLVSSFGLESGNEVGVQGVLDDVVLEPVSPASPSLGSEGSEPVMPPSTPQDFIEAMTDFSLEHSRSVPGARIFGRAKHCVPC